MLRQRQARQELGAVGQVLLSGSLLWGRSSAERAEQVLLWGRSYCPSSGLCSRAVQQVLGGGWAALWRVGAGATEALPGCGVLLCENGG